MGDIRDKDQKQFPKGHFTGKWMVIGIAMFTGLGVPLSVTTGNYGFIGIGPAIGIAIGLAIGQGVEKKYQEQGRIRPLTPSERRRQKNIVWAGIALLTMGLLTFLWLL